MNTQTTHTSLADFIWKNADDLWGNFKHVDFGKIILPFTLLRRLECVLEPTREEAAKMHKMAVENGLDVDVILRQATGYPFYNTSSYSLETLGSGRTRQNLEDYIAKFSGNARVIFEQFDFINTISQMDKKGVLYKICQNFAAIDLHPDAVPERTMSNVYEHLIRRFGAEVNEAAEDFMTPRDVVHLGIELLLEPDDQMFIDNPGIIRTLYDPTIGTGGFVSDGMEHVNALRDRYSVAPVIVPYGQELEPTSEGEDEEPPTRNPVKGGGGGSRPGALPVYMQELIERLNSLFGEATPLEDQVAFVNQVAAITRENSVVMAQINKNSKDQAMKGNLPGAVQAAVVRAMSSHSSLATLLLRKDRQALPILEGVIYEILKRGEALSLNE